jgi:adenylate cyclase
LAIGVNTGEAIVGNVGSHRRMEYTVIGDAVNVAARLQDRAVAGQILIGEDTYTLVAGDVVGREFAGIELKGRAKPIAVYEIVQLFTRT